MKFSPLIFLLLLGLLFSTSKGAKGQKLRWTEKIGEHTGDLRGQGIAYEKKGNIWICGHYGDTCDFNPKRGTNRSFGIGLQDAFVARYDSNGRYLKHWVYNNTGVANAVGIAVGANKSVYVAVKFSRDTDVDPTSNTHVLKPNSPGTSDAFLAKYSFSGSLIWVKHLKSKGKRKDLQIRNKCLSLDSSGNVILVGSYGSSSECFVMKFNSSGNQIFKQSIKGSSKGNLFFYISSAASDSMLNVYSGGYINGDTAYFSPPFGMKADVDGRYANPYFQKHSASGSIQFYKILESTGDAAINRIRLDASGNIIVIGSFTDSLDIDPGSKNHWLTETEKGGGCFLAKYTSKGELIWGFAFSKEWGDNDVMDFVVDCCGNITLSGIYRTKTDMDPSADTAIHRVPKKFDYACITARYTSEGKYIESYSNQASGYKSAFYYFMHMRLNQLGHFFITGYYAPGMDMNMTAKDSIVKLKSTSFQILTAKYAFNPVPRPNVDSARTICLGDSIIIKDTRKSTADTKWHLYENTCGGKAIQSNETGEFTVWPTEDVTYYINRKKCFFSRCDSFIVKVINPNNAQIILEKKCPKDSFLIWGTYESLPGKYRDTFKTKLGCDSVVEIRLSNYDTDSLITISDCESVTSPSGKYTWNTSGTYNDTIPSTLGCDSVLTINFINLFSSDSIEITTCKPYVSPSGKYTWSESGRYFDTIANSAGCDSLIIVTLHFPVTYSSIEAKTCKTYESPSGKYNWDKEGVFTDTLINSIGCDSVITVNLSVYQIDTSITTSVCDQYITPSGKTIIESGIYFDTLKNESSCDSNYKINLTIYKSYLINLNITVCDSLISPSSKYTWYKEGTYQDTLMSKYGCDSIIMIELAINHGIKKTDSLIYCLYTTEIQSDVQGSNFLWDNGNNTKSRKVDAPGEYWLTYDNDFGCPSKQVYLTKIDSLQLPEFNDTTICIGNEIDIDFSVRSFRQPTTFYWNDSTLGKKKIIRNEGKYTMIAESPHCTDTTSLTLFIEQHFKLNLVDSIICDDSVFSGQIKNIPIGAFWQGNSGIDIPPINKDTQLVLQWDQLYCKELKDTLNLNFIDCNCFSFYPNAFSPEGNNLNETFRPWLPCDFIEYHFSIYNRWGELIYETIDYDEPWDGTFKGEDCPVDAYMWIVKYRYKLNRKLIYKSGRVNLIR